MQFKEYLAKLIAIDTQFPHDTLEAVQWVKSIFEQTGHPADLVYNQAGTRASVIATIGDKSQPGIVFSGHLDTVPADESFYGGKPLQMFEENGRLYGRGTCDMKGAIACFLAQIPAIAKLNKTVHLVLTHDEEGGFTAINQLTSNPETVKFLQQQKACFITEPTCLRAVTAHKGTRINSVMVTGKSGHSSNPSICIDANDVMVDIYTTLIKKFRQLSKDYGADYSFVEPFSTITAGQIQGGEAVNTVSGKASFSVMSRENPGNDYEQFFSKVLDNYATPAAVDIKQTLYALSFKSTLAPELIQQISKCAEAVSYGTEAGFFEKIGLPSLVIGPGSIVQAHTKDEYVEIEQLQKWQNKLLEIINSF